MWIKICHYPNIYKESHMCCVEVPNPIPNSMLSDKYRA